MWNSIVDGTKLNDTTDMPVVCATLKDAELNENVELADDTKLNDVTLMQVISEILKNTELYYV